MNPYVLVHGFAGTPGSWDGVVALLPPDIEIHRITIGGHAGTPAAPTFDDEVERIGRALENVRNAHICGYSLGGRLTLGLLARWPERFARATIIGAHPGLVSGAARVSRIAQDDAWADLIEREGVAAFGERWEALPLFASQAHVPPADREAQRRARLSHDATGLAGAMRALSLGRMPHHGERITRVDLPIDLVTGVEDEKFTRIAMELAPKLRRGAHHVIAGVGHNVPLERPRAIAELLRA